MKKYNKRGTIVERKDTYELGIVYKDSGDILSILPLPSDIKSTEFREEERAKEITTWHINEVEILLKG